MTSTTEEMADVSLVNFDMPTSGSALGRAYKLVPRALTYLRPYRGKGAGLVVATTVGALIALAGPWPLAFVIDTVLKDRQPPSWITGLVGSGTGALILFAVIAMLAITLIGGVAKIVEEYLSTFVDLHMTLDFRSDLFRHVQRLSLAYHDDSRVGILIYRINQLASSVGDMVVSIPVFAQDALTMIGMGYIAYRINSSRCRDRACRRSFELLRNRHLYEPDRTKIMASPRHGRDAAIHHSRGPQHVPCHRDVRQGGRSVRALP